MIFQASTLAQFQTPQSSEKAEGQFLPALLAKKGRCRSSGILWENDSLPLGQVPTNSRSASKQSETPPFWSSRLSDPQPPGCPPLLSLPLRASAQPRQDECHGQQDPMQHPGVAAAPGGQGEPPAAQFPFPFTGGTDPSQHPPRGSGEGSRGASPAATAHLSSAPRA